MSFLSVRRIAQAAIVVSLVAGATGFTYFDKAVTLSVDGKPSAVHLFGNTVGDVLTHQGIKLNSHDLVAPAVSTPLEDNQKVVVRYGRLLTVTVDGQAKEYWTTSTTVADLLTELKISVGAKDRVTPAVKTPITRNVPNVAVARVTQKSVGTNESIAFGTQRRSDASMFTGTTKTLTAGRPGRKVLSHLQTLVDGKLITESLRDYTRKLVGATAHAPQRSTAVAA